jgi:hypothetical protein
VDGGEKCWQLRLFRSVFSHKCSSWDIYQPETNIEDPTSENVQDMEENNIFKYHSDPTVQGEVIAIRVFVINMSSLQPFSKPPKYLSFITYWLFLTTPG